MQTEFYLAQSDNLTGAYAAGRLTPTDVVNAIESLIEASDPGIWTTVCDFSALREKARAMEREGMHHYPLFGIPFSVKDNIHVKGLPTTANSQYGPVYPDASAPAVAALESAGAILIGKNTMDEFATGLVGTRSQRNPANPFAPDHIPGGSSSGSAVAVARRIVAFSLATDTGGSGRVPPALNNILGYKPSPGRLSTEGLVYANRLFDCLPIFARSLDLLTRVERVLPRRAPTEPSLYDCPVGRRVFEGKGPNGALRIGVPKADGPAKLDDKTHAHAYGDGLAWLADCAGAELQEVDLNDFLQASRFVFGSSFLAERRRSILTFTEGDTDRLDPTVKQVIDRHAQLSAEDVHDDLYSLAKLRGLVNKLFNLVDLLAMPTVPTVYSLAAVHDDPVTTNHHMGSFTYPVNVLGLSAIAVPAGFREDGIPFGLSLVAESGADDALFDLARLLPFLQLGLKSA